MDKGVETEKNIDTSKYLKMDQQDSTLVPHLLSIMKNIHECHKKITKTFDSHPSSVNDFGVSIAKNDLRRSHKSEPERYKDKPVRYYVIYFACRSHGEVFNELGFGIEARKYEGLRYVDGKLLNDESEITEPIGLFIPSKNKEYRKLASITAKKKKTGVTIYGEKVEIEDSDINKNKHEVIWLPGRLINSGKSYREILEIALNDFFGDGTMTLEELKDLLEANMQLILTGAPGTGKTYKAMKIAELMIGDGNAETHIKKVQFHPGYDYSDFIIGLKPKLEDGGKFLSYEWEDGVFKKFADTAKDDPEHNYIFIVDEINRADLSNVFGEAFSLLEDGYRGEEHKITLPNGDEFIIPENLYVIGTMNDIDRSVESMDFALRRRFAWYEVSAEESKGIIDEKVQDAEIADLLKKSMDAVNGLITKKLGSEYQLGGAYFAKAVKTKAYKPDGTTDTQKLKDELWKNFIRVILTEYLRGRKDKESELKELEEAFNKPFDDAAESKNGDKKAGSSGGTGGSDPDSDTEAEGNE